MKIELELAPQLAKKNTVLFNRKCYVLLYCTVWLLVNQDSSLTIGRELQQITANHADCMHFTHNPHELREIRYKIHPHYFHAF